jgi:tripartite-type tricarboxylate transporter receptor subunit TctC
MSWLAWLSSNKSRACRRRSKQAGQKQRGGDCVMRKLIGSAIVALGLAAGLQSLSAQEYPSRPVRVVIPFAAGAGTDLVGRIIAQALTARFGQQFFVENRPGAAALLGTDLVAKSPADGHTLLWTVTDGLSVLPAVRVSMPYKVPDDFAFIAGVLQLPFALGVNAKVPVKSVAELIAYAKANPGKLNFGSAGVGSAPHMGIALLSAAARIDMVHVPFAGLGPATNALVAGTVDICLVTPPLVKPHIDSGALRVIAVTGNKRHRVLPDVPTLQETGLNVTTIVNYGLSAPAGTPEPVLARLKQAISEIVNDKAMTERLHGLGYETDLLVGDAYRDFILKDLEQWSRVAKAANIKVDK